MGGYKPLEQGCRDFAVVSAVQDASLGIREGDAGASGAVAARMRRTEVCGEVGD